MQQPNLTPPTAAPNYMQPPAQQQPPQQTYAPPAGLTFTADQKTRELLGTVYPELTDAMICLAIKQFTTSGDFINYFVRDEFKHQAQESVAASASTGTAQQPQAAPAAKAVSFDSW